MDTPRKRRKKPAIRVPAMRALQAELGMRKAGELLGLNASYFNQLANGHRGITPEMAVRIEAATGGRVMRWDTRPRDWHRVWPELTQRPDAPAM